MANLAVAHVVITGQSNRFTVGGQLGVQLGRGQPIEGWGVGLGDRVTRVGRGNADPVGDDHQNGPGAR